MKDYPLANVIADPHGMFGGRAFWWAMGGCLGFFVLVGAAVYELLAW
jgi:hypothetical protein